MCGGSADAWERGGRRRKKQEKKCLTPLTFSPLLLLEFCKEEKKCSLVCLREKRERTKTRHGNIYNYFQSCRRLLKCLDWEKKKNKKREKKRNRRGCVFLLFCFFLYNFYTTTIFVN